MICGFPSSLFIAAHFFYLRLSLNHINFGSPPLRLAFLLASPSPRLAFLLASPSLSLPPPRAAPLWTTPSTGASSGAIAAGVHYSRSLRVIDLINYSFTIQSLPPLSSINETSSLIECSNATNQCVIYTITKYLNRTITESYIVVNENGTIVLNETIAWTNRTSPSLATLFSTPNGTFVVVIVTWFSPTQFTLTYNILFQNIYGQKNFSSVLYGFDALAINDTLFVVFASTDTGLYAISISTSGTISPTIPLLISNSTRAYYPTLKRIGPGSNFNFVLLWWSPESDVILNEFNIFGQLFTQTSSFGNAFQVNDIPLFNIIPQTAPSVVLLDSGNFAVIWMTSSYLFLRVFHWSPCLNIPWTVVTCDSGPYCTANCFCPFNSSQNYICKSSQCLCSSGSGCTCCVSTLGSCGEPRCGSCGTCSTGFLPTVPPSAQCIELMNYQSSNATQSLGYPFVISPNDTSSSKTSPAAAPLSILTNVVIWIEGNNTIRGLIINSDGNPMTKSFIIQSGSIVRAPVVSSRLKGFVVAWSQLNSTDNKYYPFVRYFDKNGRSLSLPIQVNSTGSSQEFLLSIANVISAISIASVNRDNSTLVLSYLDPFGFINLTQVLTPSDSPAPQFVDFITGQQLLCIEINGSLYLFIVSTESSNGTILTNEGICGGIDSIYFPYTNQSFAVVVIYNGSLVLKLVSVSGASKYSIVSEYIVYSPNTNIQRITNINVKTVNPILTNDVTNAVALTWSETWNDGQTKLLTQIVYINDSTIFTDPFYITTIISMSTTSFEDGSVTMIPLYRNGRFLVIWNMNGMIYGQAFTAIVPPPIIPILVSNASQTPSPTEDQTTLILLVTLPTVGGILIIVSSVVLIVLLRHYKRVKKKKKEKEESEKLQKIEYNNSKTNYGAMPKEDQTKIVLTELVQKDRAISYNELKFISDIGSGAYGKVCLGEWRRAKVAIKLCRDVSDINDFYKEALLMISIRPHPNVLQLLGVCIDGPSPAIVMEYCPRGSLDKLLLDPNQSISDKFRHQLILGIAKGMLHLHLSNVVHRDLAARNILLSADGEPKISDFGMSRVMFQGQTSATTKTNIGPIKWMAPESLKNRVYSPKSDVWSFGIVMYEIIARKIPHEFEDDLLEIAVKIRDHGVTPPIPEGCPPLYEKIMRACWKYNPEERPTFEQIIELLEGVRDEIDIVKSEKTVHQTEKTSQPKENQRTQSDKSDD